MKSIEFTIFILFLNKLWTFKNFLVHNTYNCTFTTLSTIQHTQKTMRNWWRCLFLLGYVLACLSLGYKNRLLKRSWSKQDEESRGNLLDFRLSADSKRYFTSVKNPIEWKRNRGKSPTRWIDTYITFPAGLTVTQARNRSIWEELCQMHYNTELYIYEVDKLQNCLTDQHEILRL